MRETSEVNPFRQLASLVLVELLAVLLSRWKMIHDALGIESHFGYMTAHGLIGFSPPDSVLACLYQPSAGKYPYA